VGDVGKANKEESMKFVAAAAVIAALTFTTPAQAQTFEQCEVVQAYGGTEVRETLPAGFYYLWVLTDSGWQAYRLGYSNSRIRFLLGQTTFDAYLITNEAGQIVSAC
jgi:hypothetical protein